MQPCVFFFVQNLLGIGHVVRASRIVQALSAAGVRVVVASGGVPIAGLDFGPVDLIQLPPIKAGPDGFSDLRRADGTVLDEEGKAERRDALLAAFSYAKPDILLIEAYPFGRRAQRFELVPLIKAARARSHPPLIACSLRDILQSGRAPARQIETADIVSRYFDVVLVHGDPHLIKLEASFPEAQRFLDKVVYTGIVAPQSTISRQIINHDIIVAAGGGVVGQALFEAALAARPLTKHANASWLIVGGPNLDDIAYQRLAQRCAQDGVSLARFLPDLPARYASARVVVAQAGYNTVADLLVARRPAVLVPFATGGESEQTVRAELLAQRGFAITLSESALTPLTLARSIDAACELPWPGVGLALDGAEKTAEILIAKLKVRDKSAN